MKRALAMCMTGTALFLFFSCERGSNSESGVLVSTDWLAGMSDDPFLLIFHVGTGEMFDSLHIPGAKLLDPYQFTITSDSLRNQLPDLESLDSLITSLGVGPESVILLYYEAEQLISRTARVFVTLDYLGLGDRTHVLNGGLTAWTMEGRPTSGGSGMPDMAVPYPEAGPEFEKEEVTKNRGLLVLEPRPGVIALASEVNQYRTDPAYVVGDVRSLAEYRGEFDTVNQKPAGGHIEWAIHIPYQAMLSESRPHMFKEDGDLRKELEAVHIKGDKRAVYYCGTGIRASVTYLVSVHLGCRPMLYDGSIEEWEDLKMPLIQLVEDDRDPESVRDN